MEETLIGFETAKLAKQKGFSIHCRSYYVNDTQICENEDFPYNSWSNNLFAPTQSLLQRWLREKYNVIVLVSYTKENDYPYMDCIIDLKQTNRLTSGFRKNYEEALERGLQKALKLI